METTGKYSDEDIRAFLFESGFTLTCYTLVEFNGGYAILSHRPGTHEEGIWIIDDEPLRQSCLNYLMNNGVKRIRLG